MAHGPRRAWPILTVCLCQLLVQRWIDILEKRQKIAVDRSR